MPPSAKRVAAVVGLALPVVAACASAPVGGGALEPRFVAVHNALSALGMTQVGPIEQGSLSEGREARVRVDLAAGCTTLVAMGGDGVRDLDAQLLDARGQAIAHDTTTEPQAVVKACIEAPGTFVLVVRAAAGAGRWVEAAWQGEGGPAPAAASASAGDDRQAAGTCDAPIPLSAGTVSGSTAHGDDANYGSCGDRSDAREIVYELDVPQRQHVVLEVDARFDSILYVRKESCDDPHAEIECNDDDPTAGQNHSRIERVLEPGRYFVFVDGYKSAGGAYKLTVSTDDVLSFSDECRKAPVLVASTRVSGSTAAGADDAHASCGKGAPGPEAAWRMELAEPSRVRLVEHSPDADALSPVVHVRYACADPQSEAACSDSGSDGNDATVAGVFPAGSYVVFADGRDRKGGAYDLLLETAPPQGLGTQGDGCGDAMPLPASAVSVSGDTFSARDDVAGSCGGAGAADVVYRLDVARRSRFVASLKGQEGQHLLEVWRRCGDRASEAACGTDVDEVLAPGTYFVGVDGIAPAQLGRFTLAYGLEDLSGQAGACASARALLAGRTLRGSTHDASDRFASSCAGGGNPLETGSERVYRIDLAARSRVHLSLEQADFDVALSLRSACADASGEARAQELACSADERPTLDRTLDAGRYYVMVEGQSPADSGAFALAYDAVIAR